MRWFFLWAALWIAGGAAAPAMAREAGPSLYGPVFKVGGLQFTVPSRWPSVPPANPARVGQWRVPALHGVGDDGELAVIYFGPGLGGSAKENIEAWIGTMFNAEGHPAAAEQKHHQTGGLSISQLVIFGAYNQPSTLPGVPPVARPDYGLLGAVIESPQGNIYWRFTGPEPLITAYLPLFNKVIDSVKPQDKP